MECIRGLVTIREEFNPLWLPSLPTDTAFVRRFTAATWASAGRPAPRPPASKTAGMGASAARFMLPPGEVSRATIHAGAAGLTTTDSVLDQYIVDRRAP